MRGRALNIEVRGCRSEYPPHCEWGPQLPLFHNGVANRLRNGPAGVAACLGVAAHQHPRPAHLKKPRALQQLPHAFQDSRQAVKRAPRAHPLRMAGLFPSTDVATSRAKSGKHSSGRLSTELKTEILKSLRARPCPEPRDSVTMTSSLKGFFEDSARCLPFRGENPPRRGFLKSSWAHPHQTDQLLPILRAKKTPRRAASACACSPNALTASQPSPFARRGDGGARRYLRSNCGDQQVASRKFCVLHGLLNGHGVMTSLLWLSRCCVSPQWRDGKR